MNYKVKKTSFISALSALLICALVALVGNFTTARAAEFTADDYKVSSVAIRLVDDEYGTGVRFTTKISKNKFDNLTNPKTAVLIMPEAFIDGEITAADADVLKIETTARKENGDFYESAAYVYDIPAASFGLKLVARGYLTYEENGETKEYYTAQTKAYSLTDVALAAPDSVKEQVKSYIVEKATVTFKDGETQLAQTEFNYGNKITYPATSVGADRYVEWKTSKNTVWNTEWTAQQSLTLTANYVDCFGYEIAESAFLGTTATTEVAVPTGYTKVSKRSNFRNGTYSTVDISAYGEVRFATLFTENYYLWEGSNKCFKCESWVEWSFKNNGDGTWAFTAVGDQNSYTSTVKGSTLEQLAYNYYAGDNKTVYVTEFRGELLSHFNVSGEIITDTLFENSKDKVEMKNVIAANAKVPYGFKKVWQYKGINGEGHIHGKFYAGEPLTGYSSVNFAIKTTGTFILDDGTTQTGIWLYFNLTQSGENSWDVTVKNIAGTILYKGAGLSGYYGESTVYTSNALNAILYGLRQTGFYVSGNADTMTYFTEVRGVPKTDKQLTRIAVASKYEDETSDRREDAIINYYAIKEAKKWLGEFANIDGVEYITDESMLSSSVYYIVIGNAFSDGNYSGLTTDTGYKIAKRNGNVYLYGKTGYGTLNALYGLLKQRYNLEIYADTVYTFSDEGDIYYEEIREETFNPSIDYNLAYDGPLTYIKEGEVNPNYDYQRRLGFVDSWQQIGGSWHNFLDYVPQSEYGTAHPEWYIVACYENGEKSTVTTLDLTTGGDAMAKVVADKIKAQVEADEAGQNIKPVYVFGPPDERVWSNSDATIRTVAEYGTRSAEYVIFMNRVAKYLDDDYNFDRQIKLCLIAYNLVCDAPDYHADLKFYNGDEISLSVMFAPIESNMYRAADDTTQNYKYHLSNAHFTEQLSKWKALGGEVYYWNYSEYYDNYFVMLDTITNMQSKYKLMAENGVNRLIDLGMVGDNYGTDFTALKIYLKGKLARNVNENVDALVKNFCGAYYGTGGEYIYSLLTSEKARYKKVSDLSTKANNGEDAVGIHVIREGVAVKSYWDENEFDTWYGYIKSALTAIENSGATEKAKTEYKKRVMREGIAVRYMKYYVFNSFVTLASGETDSISAMITDAKSVNITRFAEGQAYVWDKRPSIIYNGRWKLVDGSIDNLA